jgi:hypothetical protein
MLYRVPLAGFELTTYILRFTVPGYRSHIMNVWKYQSLKTKDRQYNGHNETKQNTKHKTVNKSLQIRLYLIQATTQIRFNQLGIPINTAQSSSTCIWGWGMVFNATFNNISVISWRSALLVEETGVPTENDRTAVSYWQTLSHNVVLSKPCHEWNLFLTVSRCRDHMVVGFITTYAISAYHH